MENFGQTKKIVLVVEDDPTILELYEHAFKAAGFDTFIAHDGEEGLKLIRDKLPSCVILDILMPKVNGIEVLTQMRTDEKTKLIPVFVLTNYDSYREKAKELGIEDYLVKTNVTLNEIINRVKKVVEK